MEHAIAYDYPVNQDTALGITSVGRSDTMSGHRYGPAVRPYYLIHYILAGSGTFTVNRISYHLHAGQGFLIAPNYRTIYTADQSTPWSYVWLGFAGKVALSLVKELTITEDSPIFSYSDAFPLVNCVNQILKIGARDHLLTLSYLLKFLSIIAKAENSTSGGHAITQNGYVQRAIHYLSQNLAAVSVDRLAKMVNVDRSYLTALFKQELGLTPSQYLRNFRITKARHLLEASDLTIDQIANQCGYQHANSFTRTFKQTYGLSPREYRNQKAVRRD